MAASSVPELQQKLFKRMGIATSNPEKRNERKQQNRSKSSRVQSLNRKAERKQQRTQKKSQRYSKTHRSAPSEKILAEDHQQHSTPAPRVPRFSTVSEDDVMEELSDSQESADLASESDDHLKADEDWQHQISTSQSVTSRASKTLLERLAQDDAEIEGFEKKLGIKKGRKSLPKSFKDDGLDELLGSVDAGEDDGVDSSDETRKRKLAYDDWLSSKRRNTGPSSSPNQDARLDSQDEGMGDSEDTDEGERDQQNGKDNARDDESDFGINNDEGMLSGSEDDSFGGFDSDNDEMTDTKPRLKENPYKAPTTGTIISKYVPPSLRRAKGPEDETKGRLQKQIQGLVNRLTDANIISIVASLEEIYQTNARGDVTEILTDTIMAQILKPESLPDQFFVLTGGFCAALYKTTGSSFGSHLVRRIVKDFNDEYANVSAISVQQAGIPKEASNILTLMTQLYVFEVVTSKIIFDFLEELLGDLSELNVELLLRICRMAGRLLRRDDPQALKHISSVLNSAVSKIGYVNVSARTKFMIETIQDLKNSRRKAKGTDSSIVSEHVLRMKKRLGELKSQSRRLDGLAPMGIGLSDVESADTHGKWWLVGASVPAYREVSEREQELKGNSKSAIAQLTDDEDMDIVLPDYSKQARAQGLNSTAQVAIFTALMSASNVEQGYRQYENLKLKKEEQLEITRVLVQCVGSEAQYNEYYALVGRQACANGKVRFSFQDRLWKIFRGLGESLFGEDADDDDTADSERMRDERRAGHVARFYASLVGDGTLGIALLKPLDLPETNELTLFFVECFLVCILRECKSKGPTEDIKIERIFGPARDLPALAAGLHWVLRKKVRRSKLIASKENKGMQRVREKIQNIVHGVDVGA